MTKDDLIDAVVAAAKIDSKAAGKKIVDQVFETITAGLAGGDDITITGFGTFRVSATAARVGRNPKTGESINIPAGKRAKFRAGKALKEAVQ